MSEEKSKFNIGDKVRRLHVRHLGMNPGDVGFVTALNACGTNVRLNGETHGSHKLVNLELVEAKPIYPNPPHNHADVIIAWAKGAEVECLQTTGNWLTMSAPMWSPSAKYRVKPVDTRKDKLNKKLDELVKQVEEVKKEIGEL